MVSFCRSDIGVKESVLAAGWSGGGPSLGDTRK
jgi:hypothetical protein